MWYTRWLTREFLNYTQTPFWWLGKKVEGNNFFFSKKKCSLELVDEFLIGYIDEISDWIVQLSCGKE